MSLTHLHPLKLNPKVHYRSPFFCEEARRAEAERVSSQVARQRDADESRIRREAFVVRMGVSTQRARTIEALVKAGQQGLSAIDIKTIAQVGQVSPFIADLTRRLACFGVHFSVRSGAYRAIYRFTPEGIEKLEVMVAEFKAGATTPCAMTPVRIAPDDDIAILVRGFDLTEGQAKMLAHLAASGSTGATTEWLCRIAGLRMDSTTVQRLGRRLNKQGMALEFHSGWGCWRLSAEGVERIRDFLARTKALQARVG